MFAQRPLAARGLLRYPPVMRSLLHSTSGKISSVAEVGPNATYNTVVTESKALEDTVAAGTAFRMQPLTCLLPC